MTKYTLYLLIGLALMPFHSAFATEGYRQFKTLKKDPFEFSSQSEEEEFDNYNFVCNLDKHNCGRRLVKRELKDLKAIFFVGVTLVCDNCNKKCRCGEAGRGKYAYRCKEGLLGSHDICIECMRKKLSEAKKNNSIDTTNDNRLIINSDSGEKIQDRILFDSSSVIMIIVAAVTLVSIFYFVTKKAAKKDSQQRNHAFLNKSRVQYHMI